LHEEEVGTHSGLRQSKLGRELIGGSDQSYAGLRACLYVSGEPAYCAAAMPTLRQLEYLIALAETRRAACSNSRQHRQ
jgi:hypothetical protein